MARIQLELKADDPAIDGLVSEIGGDQIDRAKPDHFEGDVNIVNLLIQVTTTTIPIATLFIREHFRAKKHLKVKYKGIEVHGPDLDNIEKFMTRMLPQVPAKEDKPSKPKEDRPKAKASGKKKVKK